MRFADVVLRQGHLSEAALVAAVLTADRPPHLDRCSSCADRAVELARWLSDMRDQATAATDAAFPQERLAMQQAQILRKLEQLDEPARVIAFPTAAGPAQRDPAFGRVAPAWVGVAAAAGLIIGVIGGQVTARIGPSTAPTPPKAATVQTPMTAPDSRPSVTPDSHATDASLLDLDLEGFTPEPLQGIDQGTPRLVPTRFTARRN
ncbi:MAG: hypothetical protein ABI051_19230 [Vicinamibacterales bacterium]